MPHTTKVVSQPLTKRHKPRAEYKRLPKSATPHYRWNGKRFELYHMHKGASYRPIQSTTYLNITN